MVMRSAAHQSLWGSLPLFVFWLVLHPLQGFVTPWHVNNGGGPLIAVGFASSAARTSHLLTPATTLRTMSRKSAPCFHSVHHSALCFSTNGGNNVEKGDDDDIEQTQQDVLDSVDFCYKAAMVAGVVGVATTFLGADASSSLNNLQQANNLIRNGVYRFVFGVGLYKVKLDFDKSKRDDKTRMSATSVYDTTRTMSSLWRQSAFAILLSLMALSVPFKDYTGNNAILKLMTKVQPGGILAFALVGSIPLRILANKAVNKAEAAGTPPASSTAEDGGDGTTMDYATARSMGFVAARNMRYCMGAFGLLALLQFVTAFEQTTLIAFGQELWDVVQSLIIGGLLGTLNQQFLNAVVTVTGKSSDATKPGAYLGLWEAQNGFYSKIGSTFAYQSFFKLLPYIVAGAKVVVRAIFKG